LTEIHNDALLGIDPSTLDAALRAELAPTSARLNQGTTTGPARRIAGLVVRASPADGSEQVLARSQELHLRWSALKQAEGSRHIMPEELRKVIFSAVQAGKNGVDPETVLTESIFKESLSLTLDELALDSLGWMEFCISIETDTGQELLPSDIERMSCLSEVEEWLRARFDRS
jgi:hypothetical protein